MAKCKLKFQKLQDEMIIRHKFLTTDEEEQLKQTLSKKYNGKVEFAKIGIYIPVLIQQSDE
ncbi:MAG: hypothetical protein ACTTJH_00735 [Bacteroidales bacterium]